MYFNSIIPNKLPIFNPKMSYFRYENGGFDSSFTPAQLQQIRRISFAQVLCRTLDTIESIQPFVFLSHDNPDNDRISCQNGLLNNFDLSPWVEIHSDSNNDISKSDDIKTSTQKPKKPKPTTTERPTTTVKPTTTTKKDQKIAAATSNKVTQKKPAPLIASPNKTQNTTKSKPTNKPNNSTVKDKDKISNKTLTADKTKKVNVTQKIDDKLDFKNKSRRYEDSEKLDSRRNHNKPENLYDYDYEHEEEEQPQHEVQHVQSVVSVNNLPHKRPYHRRPVITVTENVNKYTYLINYVPRATESWRQTTTRRPHYDGDVVKVTYQTYDDTYRRPQKPYYYNIRDKNTNNDQDFYRNNRPTHTTSRENVQSSARSNDDHILTTTKTKQTNDKLDGNVDKVSSTTDNLYKLVTFGYVGTYKGDMPSDLTHKFDTTVTDSKGQIINDESTNKLDTSVTDKKGDLNNEQLRHQFDTLTDKKDSEQDVISKDFSTYETKRFDNDDRQTSDTKLSTFFLYETATRPYSNLQRPTRRHDDTQDTHGNTDKYYYIKNVLHKYSETNTPATDKTVAVTKDILKENYNNPGLPTSDNVEERSAPNKMALLDEIESKAASPGRQKIKTKKPASSAKTPSVAFQVIPSENR